MITETERLITEIKSKVEECIEIIEKRKREEIVEDVVFIVGMVFIIAMYIHLLTKFL